MTTRPSTWGRSMPKARTVQTEWENFRVGVCEDGRVDERELEKFKGIFLAGATAALALINRGEDLGALADELERSARRI